MSIYRICSKKMTDFFMKHGVVDVDKKAVYEYGFEIMLSTVAYTILKVKLKTIVFGAG